MGADLIGAMYRKQSRGEPDWSAGEARIQQASLEQLERAYETQTGGDLWEDLVEMEDAPTDDERSSGLCFQLEEDDSWYRLEPEGLERFRDWYQDGLRAFRRLYEHDTRTEGMTRTWPDGMTVLFFGGVTWGDSPIEEWEAIMACDELGVLAALGFD